MQLYYTDVSAWGALDARQRARIESLLSPRRAARAAGRSSPDVLTILAAGLLLRYCLGCTDEALLRGPHGKPRLPGGAQFSLTHGGTLAAISLASRPCGVDAEPLDRTISRPERLFSPQELSSGFSQPALWTRKEAVLKAAGCGIAHPLTSLDVSGRTAYLCGAQYVLTTYLVCGHAISCAASEPACAPQALRLAQLID